MELRKAKELIEHAQRKGADGIVSGPANAFPEIYVQLYRAVKEKKYEKAKEKQQLINYIVKKSNIKYEI